MSGTKNEDFGIPSVSAEAQIEALKAKLAEAEAKLAAIAPVEPDAPVDLDSQGFPKEYVRLHIFKGQRPDDLAYVPIGIRGFVVKVTRGEDVIIHKAFADVLKDAIEDVTVSGEGGLTTRPAHRFPFQIKGTATEAEYHAFHAKMKAGASARA